MKRFSSGLLALVAAAAALPAIAQTSATHTPVTGATAGRSPHVAMREISRAPSCGKTVYMQGGRMPTYGNPEANERCRQQQEFARNDVPKGVREAR